MNNTEFFNTCLRGQLKSIKELIDDGANLNVGLMAACQANRLNVINLIETEAKRIDFPLYYDWGLLGAVRGDNVELCRSMLTRPGTLDMDHNFLCRLILDVIGEVGSVPLADFVLNYIAGPENARRQYMPGSLTPRMFEHAIRGGNYKLMVRLFTKYQENIFLAFDDHKRMQEDLYYEAGASANAQVITYVEKLVGILQSRSEILRRIEDLMWEGRHNPLEEKADILTYLFVGACVNGQEQLYRHMFLNMENKLNINVAFKGVCATGDMEMFERILPRVRTLVANTGNNEILISGLVGAAENNRIEIASLLIAEWPQIVSLEDLWHAYRSLEMTKLFWNIIGQETPAHLIYGESPEDFKHSVLRSTLPCYDCTLFFLSILNDIPQWALDMCLNRVCEHYNEALFKEAVKKQDDKWDLDLDPIPLILELVRRGANCEGLLEYRLLAVKLANAGIDERCINEQLRINRNLRQTEIGNYLVEETPMVDDLTLEVNSYLPYDY
jgi:hypothetical protein